MTDTEPRMLVGQTVYDDDGRPLGSVRGITDDGFKVSNADGIEALSVAHGRAGHEVATGELTWECAKCGAIGDIEALPDTCPDCGASPEEIFYRIED